MLSIICKFCLQVPPLPRQDPLTGTAEIVLGPGKKVEHLGIKVELIGQIGTRNCTIFNFCFEISLYLLSIFSDLLFDKSSAVKFTTIVRELESAGTLVMTKSYPFEFNVEKAYETYSGVNVRLRYFVKVTITRNYNTNIVKEFDIIVRNMQPAVAPAALADTPEVVQPGIKMEVGIEECLHIEFEFDKQKYHLKV